MVTNELRGHIDEFFEAYKEGVISNIDNMGVWLQGFFGSGKSHLLKILSYLEVFETLDVYDFKEKIEKNIIEEFDNLYNRVESANSFAILSSMSDLSEKVK
ncbi:hypothetical protein UT300019_23960 [Clostridium sp. CTA-19]